MKIMAGFVIWNKVDMIHWLLEGVIDHFPNDTYIHIVFDNPIDGSDKVFESIAESVLTKKGFRFQHEKTDHDISEIGGHERLINVFLQSDCDILYVPQDDQKLNRSIVGDLEKLVSKYGDRLGLIGGRDGFFTNYRDMVSSPFSASVNNRFLPVGEYAERPYMNSGPVIYTKKLVQTVGNVNTGFKCFYIWDEYGYRATQAGFQNILLSMDVTHTKFGRTINTYHYSQGISEHDSNLLHNLCPRL